MDRRSFLTNGLTAATAVTLGSGIAQAAEPTKVLKIIAVLCKNDWFISSLKTKS
jgi:hypothetical protein